MRFDKSDLDKTKLPTLRHVIEYLLFLKHKGTPNVAKNLKLNAYANHASQAISTLWQRTKIPIISVSRIRRLIILFVDNYTKMVKHPQTYEEKAWNKLFMISQCKCFMQSIRTTCKCTSMSAIPNNEKDFFLDQCGPRLRSFQAPELVENISSEWHDDDIEMVL